MNNSKKKESRKSKLEIKAKKAEDLEMNLAQSRAKFMERITPYIEIYIPNVDLKYKKYFNNLSEDLWSILSKICEQNLIDNHYPPYVSSCTSDIYTILVDRTKNLLSQNHSITNSNGETKPLDIQVNIGTLSDGQTGIVLKGKDVEKLNQSVADSIFRWNQLTQIQIHMLESHAYLVDSQLDFLKLFLGITINKCIDISNTTPNSMLAESIQTQLLGDRVKHVFSEWGSFDSDPFDYFPSLVKIPTWFRLHCLQSVQNVVPIKTLVSRGLVIANNLFNLSKRFHVSQDSSVVQQKPQSQTSPSSQPIDYHFHFNYANFFESALWQTLDEIQKTQSDQSEFLCIPVNPLVLRNSHTLKFLRKNDGDFRVKEKKFEEEKSYRIFDEFPHNLKNNLRDCGGWISDNFLQFDQFVQHFLEESQLKKEGLPTYENQRDRELVLHLYVLKEYIGECIQTHQNFQNSLKQLWYDIFDKCTSTEKWQEMGPEMQKILEEQSEKFSKLLELQLNFAKEKNNNNFDQNEESTALLNSVTNWIKLFVTNNYGYLMKLHEDEKKSENTAQQQTDTSTKAIGDINLKSAYMCLLKDHLSFIQIAPEVPEDNIEKANDEKEKLNDDEKSTVKNQTFAIQFEKLLKKSQKRALKALSNYLFCISFIHNDSVDRRETTQEVHTFLITLIKKQQQNRFHRICQPELYRCSPIPRYNTGDFVITVVRALFKSYGIWWSEIHHNCGMSLPVEQHDIMYSNSTWLESSIDMMRISQDIMKGEGALNMFGKDGDFNEWFYYLKNLGSGFNQESYINKEKFKPIDLMSLVDKQMKKVDPRKCFSNAVERHTLEGFDKQFTGTDPIDKKDRQLGHPIDFTSRNIHYLLYNLLGWTERDITNKFPTMLWDVTLFDLDREKQKLYLPTENSLFKFLLTQYIKPFKKTKQIVQTCVSEHGGKNSNKHDLVNTESTRKNLSDIRYETSKETDSELTFGTIYCGEKEVNVNNSFEYTKLKRFMKERSWKYEKPGTFAFSMLIFDWLGEGEPKHVIPLLNEMILYREQKNQLPRGFLYHPVVKNALTDNFKEEAYKKNRFLIHGEDKLTNLLHFVFDGLFEMITNSTDVAGSIMGTNTSYYEEAQREWLRDKCWDLKALTPFVSSELLETEIVGKTPFEAISTSYLSWEKLLSLSNNPENYKEPVDLKNPKIQELMSPQKNKKDGEEQIENSTSLNPEVISWHLSTIFNHLVSELDSMTKLSTPHASSYLLFDLMHYTWNLQCVDKFKRVNLQNQIVF